MKNIKRRIEKKVEAKSRQGDSLGSVAGRTNDGQHAGGRPTKYKPEYCEQAYKLCKEGAINPDLAAAFKVHVDTVSEWRKAHPEFSDAVKRGKRECDHRVEHSLYERAMGYTHPEEKIFQRDGEIIRAKTRKHYPPDATSMIFWLKNRDPARWRDKHEHAVGGDITVVIKKH